MLKWKYLLNLDSSDKTPVSVIMADLTLRAFVGVYLHTCIVLHGYFSLSKTSGPTMKAAGSEILL